MKSIISFLSTVLFLLPLAGQTEIDHTEAIDEQVWEVFKKAYGKRNAELFNSIHSDDVLRISPHGLRIGEEYKGQIIRSYASKDRPAAVIDFAFEHRIHREEIAYEVGYYKVTKAGQDDPSKASYGRFHVVLKKIDNAWKITQDWDSGDINGHQVAAADFDRLKNKE